MTLLFTIVLMISSGLMILLVLLHKGRGGGLSDMFGGGVSSSLGGSSVVERNLDRLTIGIGVIWFACVIALGLLMAVSPLRVNCSRGGPLEPLRPVGEVRGVAGVEQLRFIGHTAATLYQRLVRSQ